MLPFAYFGIHSSAFSLVMDLLILFLAIIYIALIYWTFNDARRRIADPLLVGCAFVISFFPFVGPLVYTILRPPEYLEDAHERELEMRAAEARLAQLDHGLCPHCDYPVERDFVRCPSCLRKLKERCSGCARPLDPAWAICPYCETEVPAAASPARERRRRGRDERFERDSAEDAPASEGVSRVRERRSRRVGDGTRPGREADDAQPAAPAESARAQRARARAREREERNGLEQDATVASDVTFVDEGS